MEAGGDEKLLFFFSVLGLTLTQDSEIGSVTNVAASGYRGSKFLDLMLPQG